MKDLHGGPDGPEDVDAAFAEIIADLEREKSGSEITDEGDEPQPQATPDPGPDTEQLPAIRATTWRGPEADREAQTIQTTTTCHRSHLRCRSCAW